MSGRPRPLEESNLKPTTHATEEPEEMNDLGRHELLISSHQTDYHSFNSN